MEEHQHLKNEQKKRGAPKEARRAREKGEKPANTPKVLGAVEEHSLLERELDFQVKYIFNGVRYIVNKHFLSASHVPGTMLRSWDTGI